jgi:hypothetical protein
MCDFRGVLCEFVMVGWVGRVAKYGESAIPLFVVTWDVEMGQVATIVVTV